TVLVREVVGVVEIRVGEEGVVALHALEERRRQRRALLQSGLREILSPGCAPGTDELRAPPRRPGRYECAPAVPRLAAAENRGAEAVTGSSRKATLTSSPPFPEHSPTESASGWARAARLRAA